MRQDMLSICEHKKQHANNNNQNKKIKTHKSNQTLSINKRLDHMTEKQHNQKEQQKHTKNNAAAF